MKFYFSTSGALLLALLVSPAGFAADASAGVTRDNIIVKANRIPTERARVGTATYIMTAAEIETRQYRFALDALRALPGITISQNGGLGGVANVRIRGASVSQVLVRVDGIIVNDPTSVSGGFDFSTFDAGDIETIEVYAGPQSTMYGGDSIGGVINITTKSAESASLLSGYAEGGSYNTRRLQLASGLQGEVLGYRASVNQVKSDGYSRADEADGNTEDDGFENLTLSGQVSADFTDWLALVLTGRYVDAETEFDNFGGPGGDGTQLVQTSEQIWLGANLSADAFSGRLNNTISLRYLDTELSIAAFFFGTQGEQTSAEYQGIFNISDRYRLLFGGTYEDQSVTDPSGFTPKRDMNSTGLFTMLQVAATDSLDVTAGVRREDYDSGDDGNGNQYSDISENTVQLTAAWRLPNEATTLRTSWGQGFNAPTIFQLTAFFPPAIAPNQNLKPETSNGWDIGIEHTFGFASLQTQLTYFYDDTDNLIKYENGRYENIDRARRQGIELSANASLTESLSMAVSGAYISAEDRSTGQQLVGVPELTGFVNLTYEPLSGKNLYTNWTLSGDRTAFGGNQQSGFGVVEFGGAYALTDQFSVYGRIENLFDKQYQEVEGYGTADRSFYAGVRLSL